MSTLARLRCCLPMCDRLARSMSRRDRDTPQPAHNGPLAAKLILMPLFYAGRLPVLTLSALAEKDR
jgi:hypothetical protein